MITFQNEVENMYAFFLHGFLMFFKFCMTGFQRQESHCMKLEHYKQCQFRNIYGIHAYCVISTFRNILLSWAAFSYSKNWPQRLIWEIGKAKQQQDHVELQVWCNRARHTKQIELMICMGTWHVIITSCTKNQQDWFWFGTCRGLSRFTTIDSL